MIRAELGDKVTIHYTGKLDDETVFDSTEGREPLQFTIGGGQIIPGVEQAVVGMTAGESKTINVLSDKAYGPHRQELIAVIERKEFPKNMVLQVGKMLQFRPPGGQVIRAVITNVTDLLITLDGNHPLAGKDLIFEIRLVEIEKKRRA